MKFRLALFASGSGTNAEEFFKYFQHHSSVEVVLLLSNNPEAYALERAKKFQLDTFVFTRDEFKNTQRVVLRLEESQVTHIVLAGFLWLVPSYLIKAFPHRIVNIHPSLLPKFGGKGMYGMSVHERVRRHNETETGITIHEVNEVYDDGRILFQAACPVQPDDSAEQIAAKVHQLEYEHYPQVVERWILHEK